MVIYGKSSAGSQICRLYRKHGANICSAFGDSFWKLTILEEGEERAGITSGRNKKDARGGAPLLNNHISRVFNILKEKNFQRRISYPAKLIFIGEGEIKSFVNKQLLRDFVTTKSALQGLLKEALNIERNN